MAHQQESFLPFSSRQSLSCCLSRMAKRSTPKPHGPPYSLHQNRVVLFTLLQNRVALSFTSEPHGPLFTSPKLPDPLPSPPKPCGPLFPFIRTAWTSIYLLQNHMALFLSPQNLVVPFLLQSRVVSYLLQSRMVYSSLWLPGLGLNPSAYLPLQPNF